jgi:hypothetical protein
MNGRKAIVGLCALCALAVSAIAAQGASAVGTTAYTCKFGTGVGVTFSTVHCRASDGTGALGHFAIANGTTTEVRGESTDHAGKPIKGTLVATVFGATVELEGSVFSAEGTMSNSEEGGEMLASGTGTGTFTEVKVAKPASCEVHTDEKPEPGEVGVVHTEPVKATTKGQGDRVKFEAKEGNVLARFWITGAKCAIHATFTLSGTVKGTPEGGTINFTEADTTAQNTLSLNGNKAGLSASLDFEGRANPSDSFWSLSPTT